RARDEAMHVSEGARSTRDQSLADRNAALLARDQATLERDAALAERDQAVSERDSALATRDLAVSERDALARTSERLQSELADVISARGAALVMRHATQARSASRHYHGVLALAGAIIVLVGVMLALMIVLRVV